MLGFSPQMFSPTTPETDHQQIKAAPGRFIFITSFSFNFNNSLRWSSPDSKKFAACFHRYPSKRSVPSTQDRIFLNCFVWKIRSHRHVVVRPWPVQAETVIITTVGSMFTMTPMFGRLFFMMGPTQFGFKVDLMFRYLGHQGLVRACSIVIKRIRKLNSNRRSSDYPMAGKERYCHFENVWALIF